MEKRFRVGQYDTLIRDKESQKIKAEGLNPVTHIAFGDEYAKRVQDKLRADFNKLLTSQNKQEFEQNAASFKDILSAYYQLAGVDPRKIDTLSQTTQALNGGYATGVVLEKIEEK